MKVGWKSATSAECLQIDVENRVPHLDSSVGYYQRLTLLQWIFRTLLTPAAASSSFVERMKEWRRSPNLLSCHLITHTWVGLGGILI